MPRRTNPRPHPLASTESWALDGIDRRIVAELQADARLRLADLGRRIGLSAPATGERVRRLEESGVITGYHAQVDPRALGYPIAAVVRIRPAVQQLSKIPPLARESPEVVECQRVTGEDCFLLRVHVRSMQHLEEVLDRFVIYGQTTTSIVQSSAVPRRGLSVS
jgi:Lrp/AsnC family transcriptional regulator, leucine-responsive regulatory protein